MPIDTRAIAIANRDPSELRPQTPAAVLFCCTFRAGVGFAWDQIEWVYGRVADELAERGIRSFVSYPRIDSPPRALESSAAIPVVLDSTMRSRSSRRAMHRFVEQEGITLIYFTDREVINPWYALLRLWGVKCIFVHDHTSGASPARTLKHRIRGFVARIVPAFTADMVIAVSEFVAERHRRAGVVPSHRVQRVWNGVMLPTDGENNVGSVHSLLGLPSDIDIVGCAARATAEKGVDVLLRAFDLLWIEWTDKAKKPTLVYVGSGPYLEELEKIRARLVSRDSIIFMGYRQGAASLLRSAAVMVVPSVWDEAFGLTVAEAMARGQPVVATRVGGVPEIVEDGTSGVLVSPNDPVGLARALRELLTNREHRQSLANAARERIATHFTIHEQVASISSAIIAMLDCR